MALSLEVVRSVQLAVIVPANIIGNTLVVMVVFNTRKNLRTPMNYMLVNLAVADIMVALFMVTDQLFFHVVHHPQGTAGDFLCKTITGKIFTWTGSVASVCTLLAIACERFFAVVQPHHEGGKMTTRKLYLIIFSSWAFALLFCAPLFVVRKHNHAIAETGFLCRSYWSSERLALVYGYAWLFVVGVIPLGLMAFYYGSIVHNLWFTQNNVTDETQKARLSNRKRVTKTLIIVTFLFPLCWFPNLLINIVSFYVSSRGLDSIGYLVSELLVLLNSTVNPFVYAIHSRQFRLAIKTIVCCHSKRHRVIPQTTGPQLMLTPSHSYVRTIF